MAIEITTNSEEILRGKFAKTLRVLQGYCIEARGDISARTSYSPEGVHRRFADVEKAFNEDLLRLSNSITVKSETSEHNS